MLRDRLLNFGTETIASLSASTVNFDNYVDLEAHRTVLNRDSASTTSVITADIGENGMLEFNAKTTTVIAATASATLQITLYHHTLATSGASTIVTSGEVLMQTSAVVLTASTKVNGYTWIRARVPAGTVNRYLAATLTGAVASIATGAVQAWIAGPSETPK